MAYVAKGYELTGRDPKSKVQIVKMNAREAAWKDEAERTATPLGQTAAWSKQGPERNR